jgi:hypothetical protein
VSRLDDLRNIGGPLGPRTESTTRRRGFAATGVVAALVTGAIVFTTVNDRRNCEVDALTAATVGQLRDFGDWLTEHGARGVVGEVGWPQGAPDGDQWKALAWRWFEVADEPEVQVDVYLWATGQQWPEDYRLAIYRSSEPDSRDGVIDTAEPLAEVLEAHAPNPDRIRGISLADGSFGTSFTAGEGYHSENLGTLGEQYRYPSRESLEYLADRGVRDVRLALAWERLQPEPGASLDAAEMRLVREVMADAEALDMRVLLDLHSYGRFMVPGPDGDGVPLLLGSPELPASTLADFWQRIAVDFGDSRALVGYGLMNEPHDLPGEAQAWERISQEVVDAIREVDGRTPIVVPGYRWSAIQGWRERHPQPWVQDPVGAIIYEAHQYVDGESRGTYPNTYDEENASLEAAGYTRCGGRPADESFD